MKIKKINTIQVYKKYLYIAENDTKIIAIKIKEIIKDKDLIEKLLKKWKQDTSKNLME